MNILCADDDPWIGALYQQILAKLADENRHLAGRMEYFVCSMTHGQAAWELLESDLDRFDVVILDHVMPGLTGMEIVTRLRGSRYRGRIIVQSAFITSEMIQTLKEMNVNEIVHKPIHVPTVLDLFTRAA